MLYQQVPERTIVLTAIQRQLKKARLSSCRFGIHNAVNTGVGGENCHYSNIDPNRQAVILVSRLLYKQASLIFCSLARFGTFFGQKDQTPSEIRPPLVKISCSFLRFCFRCKITHQKGKNKLCFSGVL